MDDDRWARHLDEPLAQYLNRAGRAMIRQGDVPRAERYLAAAEALMPGWTMTHFLRAMARQQSGDLETARGMFEEIVCTYPDHAWAGEALIRLGNIHDEHGDTEEAARCYERAYRMEPVGANDDDRDRIKGDALCGLALMAERRGRPDEEIDLYERAVQADPLSWVAPKNLGVCLTDADQPARAVSLLQRALDLGADPSTWANLGNALEDLGDLRGAEDAYRQAMLRGYAPAEEALRHVWEQRAGLRGPADNAPDG